MTPETEFILSMAGLILVLLLTWMAFTRTKWAAR